MAKHEVVTLDELSALSVPQWLQDANGAAWCIVNTHVGAPQVMGMSKNGRSFVALEGIALPAHLADLVEQQEGYVCPHVRTNECGHCTRCGVVSAEPRPMHFDAETVELFRAVAQENARAEATREPHDSGSVPLEPEGMSPQ